HVEVASLHGGDSLRAGHPLQRVDLALYLARELEGECTGSALAQLLQLAPDVDYGLRLTLQNRAQGADEHLAVATANAARSRHLELRATKAGAGIGQREHPVQRRHRLPHPQPTQAWAEVPHLAAGLPDVL